MTSANIKSRIDAMGARARAASRELVKLSTEQKNAILLAMAAGVRKDGKKIAAANAKDIAAAEKKGLAKPMVQRLKLDAGFPGSHRARH